MVEATLNDSLTSTCVQSIIQIANRNILQQLQGCYQLKQTSNNTIYFREKVIMLDLQTLKEIGSPLGNNKNKKLLKSNFAISYYHKERLSFL